MSELQVHLGDITKLDVDAIVIADNSSRSDGGRVDGAIHRAAGKEPVINCCFDVQSADLHCTALEQSDR